MRFESATTIIPWRVSGKVFHLLLPSKSLALEIIRSYGAPLAQVDNIRKAKSTIVASPEVSSHHSQYALAPQLRNYL
ncbi:MAG: hypothetical protein EZS28_014363 [Streblomastix strix]|uniref:Uncharacterized protein n=1 Tax=Streblomastix strix TaxID=222440 RepID=A0A5J4W556_9EUKA|nr:MAG: hypothetical protein EZS28_014363 [Streblomastix strix]